VRYDWEAGDLILLPVKPGGVEHQHFSLGDEPARWMAFINESVFMWAGTQMEQVETHYDWQKPS